jgi:UDP-N-acetylglucosamine--N-acetylmuramyl-(pentapeptide) pyrophosphoryl-undecaprenol N-acetylglucosamine transferase
MSDMVMRMVGSVSRVIVSRAGSGIFEIALWGVPSVLIPIVDSHSDRQRKNAYNYARSGGAVVIEEDNLTPQILIHEVERIVQNQALHEKMAAGALSFSRKDAANIIAREVLNLALSHEV